LPSVLFTLQLPSQNWVKCGEQNAVVKPGLHPHTNERSCEQRASSKPTASPPAQARGVEGCTVAGGNPNQGLARNNHPICNPPRPGPSAPVPGCETRHHQPLGAALQIRQVSSWGLESPGQCDSQYQQPEQCGSLGNPRVSNGGDWDPGLVTGQTACLSPATGGSTFNI